MSNKDFCTFVELIIRTLISMQHMWIDSINQAKDGTCFKIDVLLTNCETAYTTDILFIITLYVLGENRVSILDRVDNSVCGTHKMKEPFFKTHFVSQHNAQLIPLSVK